MTPCDSEISKVSFSTFSFSYVVYKGTEKLRICNHENRKEKKKSMWISRSLNLEILV